jgi:hypothetical protein
MVFDWEGWCLTGRGGVLLGEVVFDWEAWCLTQPGGNTPLPRKKTLLEIGGGNFFTA